MRLPCYGCGKSVSNEVPDDTILRACAFCPECIQAGKVAIGGTYEFVFAESLAPDLDSPQLLEIVVKVKAPSLEQAEAILFQSVDVHGEWKRIGSPSHTTLYHER